MYDVKLFDDMKIGDRALLSKTVTEADGAFFIAAAADFGPVHIDETYASTTRFKRRLAPGILIAGLCTSVLTSELLGIVGVSIEDHFWFTGPVFYGDTINFDVCIAELQPETRTVVWEASARNTDGLEVLKARATIKFPRKKPAETSNAQA